MTETDRFISIIRRTPILVIDPNAALRAGNHAALSYASAISAWHQEASAALAAASYGQAGCIFDQEEGGRVESDEARGARPVGEPSSELVSVRDFLESRSMGFSGGGLQADFTMKAAR